MQHKNAKWLEYLNDSKVLYTFNCNTYSATKRLAAKSMLYKIEYVEHKYVWQYLKMSMEKLNERKMRKTQEVWGSILQKEALSFVFWLKLVVFPWLFLLFAL